jgi:hypothetical protein
MRFVTLGVGAQASPRYAPAGLLVSHAGARVMIDGGPGAAPAGRLDAWLVTDERSELIAAIRRLAARKGLVPRAGSFRRQGLAVERRPVVHTSHPTYGYRIRVDGRTIVWAPEFAAFPRWARGADLMFAEGAAWARPIRFAGGVGGHLDVQAVARTARRLGIKRLVFAHLGRSTLRALALGAPAPGGEYAVDGQVFLVRRRAAPAAGLRRGRVGLPRRLRITRPAPRGRIARRPSTAPGGRGAAAPPRPRPPPGRAESSGRRTPLRSAGGPPRRRGARPRA